MLAGLRDGYPRPGPLGTVNYVDISHNFTNLLISPCWLHNDVQLSSRLILFSHVIVG